MTAQSDSPAPSGADILAPESPAAQQPQAEGDELMVVSRSDGGALTVADVLREEVTDAGLGTYLTLESVGSDTVVHIDADALSGGGVTQVTLEGVAGVTLQQLLIGSSVVS